MRLASTPTSPPPPNGATPEATLEEIGVGGAAGAVAFVGLVVLVLLEYRNRLSRARARLLAEHPSLKEVGIELVTLDDAFRAEKGLACRPERPRAHAPG